VQPATVTLTSASPSVVLAALAVRATHGDNVARLVKVENTYDLDNLFCRTGTFVLEPEPGRHEPPARAEHFALDCVSRTNTDGVPRLPYPFTV
jgi:hypothetical protein